MNRLLCLTLFALCSTAQAQDRPVPPQDAVKRFTLPEGFQATLFAGEPDVVQPIAMTFDDRGRLWVVECLSYPKWTDKPEGGDRVVMFEDTDGDGKFDKRQVIFDKGANLSGIELGFGGIYLCSIPNLLFIPCDFNADTPKIGKPEALLDGWSLKCKHNVFNSLTWGPDGWLYGCNGIIDLSKVGKPGTPDKERIPMSCGVWRYHPTRKVFEPFAHGTTNPFGLDFDEYGEAFMTNCVIGHLWHVIPGAHFERMYGEDLNPHTYQFMKTCADHIHWGGGNWTTSRGGKGVHSEAGGGHAHVGCMVYLGDNWPDKYRNGVFMLNLHGSRINHDRLQRQGSGYVAKHEPDFMLANDPWFRGIALKYGPDGGVYVSDWTDTGECHNYDRVDLTNGRIYKITYGKTKLWQGDLSKLSDLELAKLQTHKNEWQVRHARRLLQERAVSAKIEDDAVAELKKFFANTDHMIRLRALWGLRAVGKFALADTLASVIEKDKHEQVRAWALRILTEEGLWEPRTNRLILSENMAKDTSLVVRLALASSLQRMKNTWDPNLEVILLALLQNPENASDPTLTLMIWYGIEPVINNSPKVALRLLADTKIPLVQELLARRVASWFISNTITNSDRALEPILKRLINAPPEAQLPILKGIQDAVIGQRQLKTPIGWTETYAKLSASSTAEVRDRAMRLAVVFGDENAIASLTKLVRDRVTTTSKRYDALQALLLRQDDSTMKLLSELLDDAAMRGTAIRALAAFKNDETPKALLAIYPKLGEKDKADVVQTLASRASWAMQLLNAVEAGSVPRADVSVFVARQIQGLKDKQVQEKLARVWGQIKPASKEKTELMAKYKKLLTPEYVKSADLSKGRLVFSKNCASCHRLYDDGGAIGPALTGSQRANLEYVLENVLDPSAVVAKEYQMTKIETVSGRTINGIIKQETDKALTIQTPNEVIVLPKDEIENRTQSPVSMMPEGALDKLTPEEIRDLVAYLAGKDQVALPK